MDGVNIYARSGTSPERDERIFASYDKNLKAYEGFYVGNFIGNQQLHGFIIGGIFYEHCPSSRARSGLQFAIKMHNKTEGTQLKLTMIVRVNSSASMYYITFKGSDDCYYETKVFYKFGSGWEVLLFRPALHYESWRQRSRINLRRRQKRRESKSKSKSKVPPPSDLEIASSTIDEGFHAGAPGTCSIVKFSRSIKAAARSALEEHNKNEGTDLKLKRIMRTNLNCHVAKKSRSVCYITLKATNECIYEAKVLFKRSCSGYEFKVFMFRSAQRWEPKRRAGEVSNDQSSDLDIISASTDEGFHFGAPGTRSIILSDEVEAAAKLALKEHNKNEGTDLKLKRLMRTNEYLHEDMKLRHVYYITFEATNKCIYEAKVLCKENEAIDWSKKRNYNLRVLLVRSAQSEVSNDQSLDLDIISASTDEGFHDGAPGTRRGFVSSCRIQAAARLALEEHNKTEVTDLELEKIMRTNVMRHGYPDSPCIYYITLKTTDKCFYEAKVFCNGRKRSNFRVLLFRSAQSWKPESNAVMSTCASLLAQSQS